jgi:signal transduction histidine kinase
MRRDLDELEFLSEASVALAELPPDKDIFQVVTEQLSALAPECLVFASSYEARSATSVVRSFEGPADMVQTGLELVPRPVGLEFPVTEEARHFLSEGTLDRVSEGIHQLVFRAWPAEFAHALEERLGVVAVYAQPFSRRGDFLGTVAFLSRTPELEHQRLIEVFVRIAAVAIQRRRAEAELRESECRFRMLAENSRDIVFKLRLKPAPRVEYVNPIAARLTGYAPAELYADPELGAPCIYPKAWLDPATARAELAAEPIVAQCQRRDGTLVWMEQNFTLSSDARGNLTALEGISRDITKRKEAEEALLEADRRKSEFRAILSHELRNPLGSMSNAVYVLGRAAPGSERARRALAVIERQLAQLSRLIDDLLDVTRITRGRVELRREPLELGEIIRAIAEDYRSSFAKRRIHLEVHVPPSPVFIDGDRTRIRQILENLLHNALKFTPLGGQASISVAADGDALLRVQNSGPPIPADVLDSLFEPFVQADHTLAHSAGGLGLGLALTKGLVDLHGGRLQVESDA